MADTLNLVLSTIEGSKAHWVCGENMKTGEITPLACFVSEEALALYLKLFNNTMMMSHENGRLNI